MVTHPPTPYWIDHLLTSVPFPWRCSGLSKLEPSLRLASLLRPFQSRVCWHSGLHSFPFIPSLLESPQSSFCCCKSSEVAPLKAPGISCSLNTICLQPHPPVPSVQSPLPEPLLSQKSSFRGFAVTLHFSSLPQPNERSLELCGNANVLN